MTDIIHTTEVVPQGYHYTNAGILPNDWTSRQLSSIVEEITEAVGTRRIETVSISAGIGFVNQAKKFGKELSGKQYEKYIVLRKGDFSYNKGNSNAYPQGCIYRLNNRTEAAVPNVFESFRVSAGNPNYYEQLFISGFLNRQLYSKINRGVRDDGLLNLKGKDFYSCEVPYPPLAEQERIAEILNQCDNVIELKQKKIDEISSFKKECLRRLFPAAGCSMPDVRFSGFTNDWELRKLSNLCSLFTDGDWIEAKDQSNDGVRLVQTGNVGITQYLDKPSNAKWISEDTFNRLKCAEIFEGDILISRLPDPAGRACIMPDLGTKMITAVDCTIVRTLPEVNSEYLVQYLSTERYFKEINVCLAGGTRQRVSRGNLAEFDIPLPNSAEEQKAIGDYFKSLDHLITLHQQELEEYKSYKSSLAKLLLTGIVRVKI